MRLEPETVPRSQGALDGFGCRFRGDPDTLACCGNTGLVTKTPDGGPQTPRVSPFLAGLGIQLQPPCRSLPGARGPPSLPPGTPGTPPLRAKVEALGRVTGLWDARSSVSFQTPLVTPCHALSPPPSPRNPLRPLLISCSLEQCPQRVASKCHLLRDAFSGHPPRSGNHHWDTRGHGTPLSSCLSPGR